MSHYARSMARDADNPEDVEVVIWRDGRGQWRCNIHIDHDHRRDLVESGGLDLAAGDGLMLRVVALDPLPRDTIKIEHVRVSLPLDDGWVIDNS